MPSIEVLVSDNESIDSALRRFKRQCEQSGLKAEMRRHEYYEKPSARKKRKLENAKRNQRKRQHTNNR